jgi:hypothetical protein
MVENRPHTGSSIDPLRALPMRWGSFPLCASSICGNSLESIPKSPSFGSVCSHAALRKLGRAPSLIELAQHQTRLFQSADVVSARTTAFEPGTTPIDEVVRMRDLSVA